MVAHRLVQRGEVAEAGGRAAVLGTQLRLTDRERSLVQRQRLAPIRNATGVIEPTPDRIAELGLP